MKNKIASFLLILVIMAHPISRLNAFGLPAASIYYEHNNQLYKQVQLIATNRDLSLPDRAGGGYYDANGTQYPVALKDRVVIKKGYYLVAEFTISCKDEDHFKFGYWQLRFGDYGSTVLYLNEIMGFNGPGTYKAVIDLSEQNIPEGIRWYGSYIRMAFGEIHVSKFELVSLKPIKSYNVSFVDHLGRIIKMQRVAKGEAAAAPEPPIRPGYTFIGWKEGFKNITTDLHVHPEYRLDARRPSYIIRTINGRILNNGSTTASLKLSDVCRVKALSPAPVGKMYCWRASIEGKKVVYAYGDEISFNVTGPIELEAKLVAESERLPVAFCSPMVQQVASDNESQTVLFALTFSLPPNSKLLEFGTVSIQALALRKEEQLTLNTPGATVFKGSALNAVGQWYRPMHTNAKPYVAVRGFLIYSDAKGVKKTTYSNTVTYGSEQEYLNIQLRNGDEIGVWWWHPVNLERQKDRKYLNFLEKNGVTKIYGGFDPDNYRKSAEFIEEANKRGINVVALSGSSNWVTTNIGGLTEYVKSCIDYNNWAKKNKRGVLYGVQIDLEPYEATPEIWRQYAKEVKKGYVLTRGTGLSFEMCINSHLDDINMEGYNKTYVDLSGYKGLWLSEWVAEHSDSVVLMSYGDSAGDAHNMSLNELKYAQSKKRGRVISGQETGPEAPYVTYYDDSKALLYQEARKLYQMNLSVCKDVPTGIAFHNVQTWYQLE